MTDRLAGKTALVTGAAQGIGKAIAARLAADGALVIISDVNAEGGAAAAKAVGGKALAISADVSDEASVKALFKEIEAKTGGVDILVNNASIVPFIAWDDVDLAHWQKIIAVNLTGPMRLIKAVAPVMKAQGRGRIVNIASVAGVGPTGSSIAYAVSKAGLIHLTRCMAVALAPETLVNCVAPGLLEGTRATANLRPEQVERSASSSLLKKAADKDDCADMVVAMCRTETMTGQTTVIDAGRLFH